ncbi:MAG: DUF480 domain-containing protein [Planctomycetota bacterium]
MQLERTELDRTERRILGSLIEKRGSTPDQYPLSLNALVAACNQRSNRDPVLELEEFEITGCLLGLREKGLVLIRERDGGRVQRYAEKLSEELSLGTLAAAILAELMLRGPQTAPELARRCARMAADADLAGVEENLAEMARTHLVILRARQSGQRMARWAHLLAPEAEGVETAETVETTDDEEPVPAAPVAPSPPVPEPIEEPDDDLRSEIETLRREVAELRDRLERLESVVL